MMRTHTCGELRMEHVGQEVTLCGWVQWTREMGPFTFMVIRDRYGFTQINFEKDNPELFEMAKTLGREFVIQVTGEVKERESKNPKMPTGDIEIIPSSMEILNPSELPPIMIENDIDSGEDTRMEYRYLDLRRPKMTQNMILRAKTARAVREYLDNLDFLEIETPMLIKSTPEGARDFVVPSRLHHGTFYALPQSPQILKQLLMVSGMDRYYQIVKCFRDEDFRGDRQPEFTQIDCEMSFASQEDIWDIFSGLTQHVFKKVINVDLPEIPRYTYADVMRKYGSDKPDLRFDCEIVELNEIMATSGFGVFEGIINDGGLIAGINAKGCGTYSNKQVKALEGFVKDAKRYDPEKFSGGPAKALTTIQFREDGTVKSSLPKGIFDDEKVKEIAALFNAQPGDLVLIVADKLHRTRRFLGDLRVDLSKKENWADPNKWSVFWVVDFPLFEEDPETGERTFAHHPFCMPHPDDIHLIDSAPEKVRAMSYDMVMNGSEVLSGSVRVHKREIQEKIFDLLGMDKEEQEAKFGFMLKAFQYGAPPHAGCAFGVDRWVALMAGENSIRDVIAFPKSAGGRDIMMDAPAPVDAGVLNKDLNLEIIPVKEKEEAQ